MQRIEVAARSLEWNAERPWTVRSHTWTEKGVPFVDLSREPAGAALEAVTLPGDPGHFTADTNRLFAEQIATVIP